MVLENWTICKKKILNLMFLLLHTNKIYNKINELKNVKHSGLLRKYEFDGGKQLYEDVWQICFGIT